MVNNGKCVGLKIEQVSSPGLRVFVVCFWAGQCFLTVRLYSQVYKWAEQAANGECQGWVLVIPLVAACYNNR